MAEIAEVWRLRVIGCAALTLSMVCAATGAAAQPYYQGKTITILVGFQPGSGIDLNAREFARFMPEHIPGNPTMIVQNRAGGGTAAQNYVYENARPDGLTIIYSPWEPIGQITRHRALRVRYDRVAFIGGGGTTRVSWGNGDVIPDPASIVEVSRQRQLVVAGYRVTGSIDLLTRMALDIIGADYRMIFGYDQATTMLALPQGEVHFGTGSTHNWFAAIKPAIAQHGKGKAIWYYPRVTHDGSIVRDEAAEVDFRMYFDVYREIHGRDAPPAGPTLQAFMWMLQVGSLSQLMWAPPGTPEEAVRDLRTGFWTTVSSQDYIDYYNERYGGPLEFSDLESALAIVRNIETSGEPVAQFYADYIARGRAFAESEAQRRAAAAERSD